MKKKILFLALIVILTTGFIVPGAVQAQSGPTVSLNSAETNFPTSLTFNISARSDVNITDIRLHYSVDRMKFAEVIAEGNTGFAPAKQVATQYVMDMRQTGGMPPGSSLTYWWTVIDANGNETETLPQQVEIQDRRYNWQSIKEGLITLYWYKGNSAFANELMDATQQALVTLADNSGAALENPISMYIYASAADLQGSMIYAQDWTGGVAYTEYGIIAIGIGTSSSDLAWGKKTISHELSHLVVHQVTFNPYNQLPPWLDEGLAMNSEGELDLEFTAALTTAEQNHTLISVRSLSSPFSAYTDQALLAYAESYSIVKYLINEYGREKMYEMLASYKEGISYDGALKAVYGFDMEGLNILWQAAGEIALAR